MNEWLSRFTARFSESSLPLAYSFAGFLFFVLLRTFLEVYREGYTLSAIQLAHYVLFYLALAMALGLIVHALTGQQVVKLLRLIFAGLIVTLLPPILDSTLFASHTPHYDYLRVKDIQALLHAYLTFFGPLAAKGISLGMRVEIGLICLLTFLYVQATTRSWPRAIAGMVASYTLMFFFVSIPVYLDWLAGPAGREATGFKEMPLIFALMVGIETLAVCTIEAPAFVREILKDTRFLRIVHYELLFFLGTAASPAALPAQGIELGLRAVLAFCAIWLIWIYSVMVNNVYDIEIDRVNEPHRPLVKGSVDPVRYVRVSRWVLLAALALALSAGVLVVMLTLLFGLAYFVYSAPPLRLKERCVLSKVVIGISSVSAFLVGYSLYSGNFSAPVGYVGAIFAWFTLGAYLIDLKDVEGDKAAGIRNLPTVLGLRRAQRVAAIAVAIAHAAAFWIIGRNGLGWTFLPIGALQFIAVNAKVYREKPILLMQNGLTAAVLLFVTLK
ncbi:MAG: UbiA family prenyltransferase [Nitrospirae bacterium]|nr:UbiA family prenyltransferase [Nitrospirota bacterium]